ncbi:hypothetical protein [Paenibacillus sp.]|nr:hypothetical protein [Paenibacillus sp.]HZG84213.1 hypothetical protein [Paenibacillus sp.]
MFIYGADIPLEDARLEESTEPTAATPVEPMEYPFEYGKDIFPAPEA